MKARIIMKNEDRLLAQDAEGHYYIAKGHAKPGDDLDLREGTFYAMPSFLFAVAVLNDSDPESSIGRLYESGRKWSW